MEDKWAVVYIPTLFKANCKQNINEINKFVLDVFNKWKLQIFAQVLGKVG